MSGLMEWAKGAALTLSAWGLLAFLFLGVPCLILILVATQRRKS
jgi:hypothetical protein